MSDINTLKQEGEKIAKKLGLKKAKGYTEPVFVFVHSPDIFSVAGSEL